MSTDKPRTRIVEFSALILVIGMGTRQSLGIFLTDITEALNIGRETFSLAIAIQSLIFGLPFVGILADRYGSRGVAIGGGFLYCLAAFLVAFYPTSSSLFMSVGVLMGIALSCTSYVVVLGAVAQSVAPEKRSMIFGLLTAAGSFGMFLVVPALQWVLDRFGWQAGFYTISGLALMMVLFALQFPSRRSVKREAGSETAVAQENGSMLRVLKKAGTHSGYWLLMVGFFVCGFHVAFVATHLPAFLTDNGVGTQISAIALSLIGLFNMLGSSLFGYLGDLYRKKYLLSFIYLGRAIAMGLFIFLPITDLSAILFGATIGFLWLATVPLTSGSIAHIFGSRYLSTLYGIVFFSHQIGAFLGVWLGGRVYDATGDYTAVWLAGIALGILAFFVHLPITDKPVIIENAVPATS